MIHLYLPLKSICQNLKITERKFATAINVSRSTIRQFFGQRTGVSTELNFTINSINKAANFLDREIEILATPREIFSEFSTVAIGLKIEQSGFESWKLHIFDLVDEFRRTLDPRLLLLPPHNALDFKLKALLASVSRDLSTQYGMSTPLWACQRYFLSQPWFVSDTNSLKASAILESPLPYRMNNIFVLNNFLSRA